MLGLLGILRHPGVLAALDPRYGLGYLFGHGMTGFLVLGGVFLCATGAEALYADMGHFGPRPIRLAWYGLVLPTLLLNYAGQAAVVVDGEVAADANPFFVLCPAMLAGAAGRARHRSDHHRQPGHHQRHLLDDPPGDPARLVPAAAHHARLRRRAMARSMWVSSTGLLMVLTLGLALGFRSSDNLASAFGIAVSLTMLLTSLLMFLAMREVWGWSLPLSIAVAGLFVIVDLSFVAANMMKVVEGGWVPLVVGATAVLCHVDVAAGPRCAGAQARARYAAAQGFHRPGSYQGAGGGHRRLHDQPRRCGAGAAAAQSQAQQGAAPSASCCCTWPPRNIPRVAPDKRVEVAHLGDDFHSVVAYYGFMQHPNVPRVLERCSAQGLIFNMMDTSFFVGRVTIVPARKSRYGTIRCKLFEAMHRNALAATEFFRIPPNRVIELGGQVEI